MSVCRTLSLSVRLGDACLFFLFELADVGGRLQIVVVKRGSHSFPVRLLTARKLMVFSLLPIMPEQ
jgi:hypothetical protein